MGGSDLSISAVIGTRNRPADIVRAVTSALDNVYHEAFEVIVVDQSDDHQTELALRAFDGNSRLRYIRSADRGISRARNQGVAAAKGRIIAFTDDDCTVPRNWLTNVSEEFSLHPLIGGIFARVEAGPHDPHAGVIPVNPITRRRKFQSLLSFARCIGMGAGMAVRREAFESVGGFDPLVGVGSTIPAAEDHDLALRMLIGGWSILETPQVKVVHHGFRTHDEFRTLTRRDWVGIGAVHAKLLRAGHFGVTGVIGFSVLVHSFLKPLSAVLRARSPRGLRRQIYYWEGFRQAFSLPIDKLTSHFAPAPASSPGREVNESL